VHPRAKSEKQSMPWGSTRQEQAWDIKSSPSAMSSPVSSDNGFQWVPELSLYLSRSNSWLSPPQLLLSEEESLKTDLCTPPKKALFTTHFCPMKLPTYNFLEWTTQKTLFLYCIEWPLPSNGWSYSCLLSSHCLAPGVYITMFWRIYVVPNSLHPGVASCVSYRPSLIEVHTVVLKVQIFFWM
jgi:hypothetical protein